MNTVLSIAFSPGGEFLVLVKEKNKLGSGDNTIRLWYFLNGSEINRLQGYRNHV